MKTNLIQRTAMTAAAGALALGALAPGAAFAQSRYYPSYNSSYGSSYDENGQYYYDGCSRSSANRTAIGGVVGGIAGAAIGNNTSRHHTDDNALIGGILGAVAGAAIGHATAACEPEPRPQSYSYGYPRYNSGYGYSAPRTYSYNYPSYGGGYAYGDRYDDRSGDRYYDGYDQGYGRNEPACTYVEDSIRLPDGRVQQRMVHVCRDSSGRYQVVQ